MKIVEKAPLSATDKLAPEKASTDLVTVNRDAVVAATELIAEGIREQMGWQYKQSEPVDLARLLLKASVRPYLEFPGLADLIRAHEMLTTLAATPVVNDPSPEGIARLRLGSRWVR